MKAKWFTLHKMTPLLLRPLLIVCQTSNVIFILVCNYGLCQLFMMTKTVTSLGISLFPLGCVVYGHVLIPQLKEEIKSRSQVKWLHGAVVCLGR